jgi:integrase
MPTIRERSDSKGRKRYQALVRLRGHREMTETFDRLTDAKRWAQQTEAALRRGDVLVTEGDNTTLHEALQRRLNESTKLSKRDRDRLKAWQRHPLAKRYLSKLRGTDFAEYRDKRRAEGKAENTIAIELKAISKLYKIASRDWGMEGLRNPIKNVTMPGPSNRRERRVSADEEARLLEELRKTPYMAPLAELAIETAMRQGELLALTWGNIDLQKRIAHLPKTKNGTARNVPLSTRAVAIIETLPRAIKDDAPLFPLRQDAVIRTFKEACTAAKIANLKFHDLRHEATSRICDKLPMHEAMAITGHKTPSMLMRYYHPKAEDLARKLA